MTRRDKFFNDYPEAPRDCRGDPEFCPSALGYSVECKGSCEEAKCWLVEVYTDE